MMDWGDAEEFVSFGEVSAEDADCEADVFLLIAPQNVVGSTIMTNLLEMVRRCQGGDVVRLASARGVCCVFAMQGLCSRAWGWLT